jgi:hypothetical protein
VLLGVSEGGPLCTLFAATHPSRTQALIMIGSYARRMQAPDYPWGSTQDERDRFCQSILDGWGGPVGIEERAPSKADDPAFRDWWASYLRMGASPGAAVALTRMNAAIDVRAVLPSVRVPTLVLHRRGDRCLKVEEGRYLAEHIPGAEFVEEAGEDHLPFVGDQEAMLSEIERFLARTHASQLPERVLASMLAVCAPGARPAPAALRQLFEREAVRWRGQIVQAEADRLVARFDGPGRAVQCGAVLMREARDRALPAAAGVHIGEVDPLDCHGPVLDVADALSRAADAHEVRVSRTVVDLVPGSGLRFEPRGLVLAGDPPRDLEALALAP